MQFGLPRDEPERPQHLRWDGTRERAREMQDWGRDAALLPYIAVTPPDRNAAERTPGAGWQMKLLVETPADRGGGRQWVDVPNGATVHLSGSDADPIFTLRTPKMAAQQLDQNERP